MNRPRFSNLQHLMRRRSVWLCKSQLTFQEYLEKTMWGFALCCGCAIESRKQLVEAMQRIANGRPVRTDGSSSTVRMRNGARISCGLIAAVFWVAFTALAGADWREDIGELRIGVVTGFGFQAKVAELEPFRLTIQDELNIPVEIYPARDLPDLIRAHTEGRVEYAVLSSLAFATGFAKCECIEASVVASSVDGALGIRAALIARNGGIVDGPEDLEGKRVLASSQQSATGFGFATYQWQQMGAVNDLSLISFEFVDDFEEAVRRFGEGEGDALLGWSSFSGDPAAGYSRGTLRLLSKAETPTLSFRSVWRSPLIPNRVHSLRKALPAELKNRLRMLLVEMRDIDPIAFDVVEPDYGGGFVAARQGLFTPLVDYVQSMADTPVPSPEQLSTGSTGKSEQID